MTAAAPAGSRRPPRPRPSLALPLGIVAFAIITWVSISSQFGIGLDVAELIDDITRGSRILYQEYDRSGNLLPASQRGLLAPNWESLPRTFGPMLETIQMAILAAIIGCSVALPVAFLLSRVTTPNRAVYVVGRSILSVIRSIPDLLYAIIFVAAVGIGPLPGIAALILFNVGVVGKLLSETVDGVDQGPIEAARASGGTRVQWVRWSVFPQVLPNYVAYSLYIFELNVRASTVLGIVGAGGIGRTLFAEFGFLRWSNVSVIIVELFVLVFFIELVSIALRRRLV
ncbi:MAG TPA: phosphonate ABC transporter, permease protein PhnE [Candidatus Limnocylindria bacterium]|nr:phosphonate ABC transporter, permease protein PhnE [Candidatus Limnocylindria bacterium]